MPAAGSVRYVFPGGNTAFGFYSFYDDIIKNAFTKLFILKGGPGVGKSTLIKRIGSHLLQQGYDIEYHCCSSDKNSFDGLLVPALGIAIVDGTAPHRVVSTQETVDKPSRWWFLNKVCGASSLSACFSQRLKHAAFPPPDGRCGGATVRRPFLTPPNRVIPRRKKLNEQPPP